MKIAYDASRANRAQRSGIENYALSLLLALTQSDDINTYDVYVDDLPIPELQNLPSNFTLCLVRPPTWRRWLNRVLRFPVLWTELSLAAALKKNPPDLLFVPSYLIPRRYSGKAVAVVHDLGFLAAPEVYTASERRLQVTALKRNLSKCDRVVAVSNTTREEIKKRYPEYDHPIDMIYPGVDHHTYLPASKAVRESVLAKYQITTPYLLYVGNLLPKKGLETLIRALAQLIGGEVQSALKNAASELTEQSVVDRYGDLAVRSVAMQPAITLVIVGRGEAAYSEALLELAKTEHVASSIRMLGYLPTEEVVALMSGALAYVQSSQYEGFGLPVVEAMACGAPVLVTDRGALPEIVAYPEAIFPANDFFALARRITELLQRPDLYAQLSADSQLRAYRFRWERAAEDLLRVFAALKPIEEVVPASVDGKIDD